MNKSRIAIIALAVAVAAVAAVLVVPNLFHREGSTKVIIAINAPLTGPISAWSGQFANGFKMGIEDASRANHIDISQFSLDVQDNAGKPEQAVSIFRKQELSGFNVYITAAAGPVNAVAPLVDPTGKPQFLASFDPFITRASPNRFRIMANSRLDAPLLIQYAKTRKAKHVHVIYLNYPNLQEQFAVLLQPQLTSLGIKVTREVFDIDVRDFRTIVAKAKAQSADLIFVMGFSFHLQPLIRDLRVAGLTSNERVVANLDFVDLVYSDVATEELQGIVFVAPLFDVAGKVPKAVDWRKRYEQMYGVKPTYVPAYAYDNATLIVDAFVKSGKVTTESILAAVPFDGLNGTIALDENRDIVATVVLAKVDGERRVVELQS